MNLLINAFTVRLNRELLRRLADRPYRAATSCHRLLVLFLLLKLSQAVVAQQADKPSQLTIQHEQFFVTQVLPILREHCYECHSHASGEANGNLMLDSLAALNSGGSRGAAINLKQLKSSLLLKAIEYSDPDLQMPPTQKLADSQIESIRQWITAGAVMPVAMHGESGTTATLSKSSLSVGQTHWAYQPIRKWHDESWQTGLGPAITAADNPIDTIVEMQLAEAGLSLSPPAELQTLLRRLSYDLTGLPASLEETQSFLSDARDDRSVTVAIIDRLLAAPSFGERWARMWMDVARYADNKGYVFQEDREYPGAHRYRSWLIDAFNQDLPYDLFLTKQLAADLLAEDPAAIIAAKPPNMADDLPALGFLTLGRRFLNNKQDIIDDRLDVVARGLMGMTLTCARCHDHKYDPVTQADYYALFGVFLNTDEPGGEPWPHRLTDSAERRESFILIRGSPFNRGPQVAPRFVSFLARDEKPFTQGSGRLEMAAHIVSPQNPLTARVMANRVWLQLTGSSLVESPSDFGLRCGVPKQWRLLDHLASTLIDSGWSIKHLMRAVVTSRVYQQASWHRADAYAIDPENTLYWKMNRRRLDFEALRDTLLARVGELDQEMHGKSTPITSAPFSRRRTVYAYIDRQNLPQLFRTFDFASPDTHSPQRAQTSVPQQGLYLLNSDFLDKLARQLASRAESLSSQPSEQLTWMFQQVLCRVPSHPELEMMLGFLGNRPGESLTMNQVPSLPTLSPNSQGIKQLWGWVLKTETEFEKLHSQSSPMVQLAGALLATNELAYID